MNFMNWKTRLLFGIASFATLSRSDTQSQAHKPANFTQDYPPTISDLKKNPSLEEGSLIYFTNSTEDNADLTRSMENRFSANSPTVQDINKNPAKYHHCYDPMVPELRAMPTGHEVQTYYYDDFSIYPLIKFVSNSLKKIIEQEAKNGNEIYFSISPSEIGSYTDALYEPSLEVLATYAKKIPSLAANDELVSSPKLSDINRIKEYGGYKLYFFTEQDLQNPDTFNNAINKKIKNSINAEPTLVAIIDSGSSTTNLKFLTITGEDKKSKVQKQPNHIGKFYGTEITQEAQKNSINNNVSKGGFEILRIKVWEIWRIIPISSEFTKGVTSSQLTEIYKLNTGLAGLGWKKKALEVLRQSFLRPLLTLKNSSAKIDEAILKLSNILEAHDSEGSYKYFLAYKNLIEYYDNEEDMNDPEGKKLLEIANEIVDSGGLEILNGLTLEETELLEDLEFFKSLIQSVPSYPAAEALLEMKNAEQKYWAAYTQMNNKFTAKQINAIMKTAKLWGKIEGDSMRYKALRYLEILAKDYFKNPTQNTLDNLIEGLHNFYLMVVVSGEIASSVISTN